MTKPTAHITPQKEALVAHICDLLAKSKSVAVVDYQGLKVSQATELRKVIKKAGGQYLVTKNTLFQIASGTKDLKLAGISGFVFSQSDEVSAIKAVADFAKKSGFAKPTFKSGLLGDRVLTAAEITQLSAIPDKHTLLTQTVSSLKSPLFNLVYSLNWNISKLVRTLDAIKT